MFDVNFYMKVKRWQLDWEKNPKDYDMAYIQDLFEKFRDKNPFVYNIETTNACNMRCKMCPRTTMMTRKIETLDKNVFTKIIEQLRPFSDFEWSEWEKFCQDIYNIYPTDMSENHFFLYIIPKVIQLHGYGDPLLDKHIVDYVRLLKEKGFYSYFSCNPANIDYEMTAKIFESGLDYIKYSIESVDDRLHKQIRGDKSNFSESYNNILRLLKMKKDHNYRTTIIITMLDLNRQNQKDDYQKLKDAFKDLDVYIYLKSEDQQWYRKDYHGTKSIHWSEFCKHPWMSMTIKSNGEAVMCMEDYNNEIILGDARIDTLYNIWNGDRYNKFRKDHFNLTKGIKCTEECDMTMIGKKPL